MIGFRLSSKQRKAANKPAGPAPIMIIGGAFATVRKLKSCKWEGSALSATSKVQFILMFFPLAAMLFFFHR